MANNPETGVIGYTYDLGGNLKTRSQGGRTVNYDTCDVLNRLTAKSYSDGTPAVSYVWDTVFKGRLSEVSNSVSRTRFGSYDAMGRVTASSQATPPTPENENAKVFAYSYNAARGLEQEFIRRRGR